MANPFNLFYNITPKTIKIPTIYYFVQLSLFTLLYPIQNTSTFVYIFFLIKI